MVGDILAERTMLAFSSEGLQDMRKSRVRQSVCQMLVWMIEPAQVGRRLAHLRGVSRRRVAR